MNRIINIIVLIGVLMIPSLAHADKSKMDLMLQGIHQQRTDDKVMLNKSVSYDGEHTYVSCLVKTNDALATEAAIVDAGGEVMTVLQTILTAKIPLSALEMISDREEVVALEADRLLSRKMNMAREFTHVVEVQDGTGLPQAYKGNAVLVAVADSDIDWSHSDFSGRVQWVQALDDTDVGLTCDKQEIDNNTCSISPIVHPSTLGHGTHVTGIAAGADNKYTGVAPEAWIAFAINLPDDADPRFSLGTTLLNNVGDLFEVADLGDWPAVVNLSLGTSIGAHDDTSLLEQGLNQLPATHGNNGRIIVNAAGNENVYDDIMDWVNGGNVGLATITGGLHAEIDTNTDTGWRFGIWNEEAALYAPNDGVIVDLWLDVGQASDCQFQVLAYGYNSDNFANIDADLEAGLDTDEADIVTQVINFGDPTSTAQAGGVQITVESKAAETGTNNKPHAEIKIKPTAGTSPVLDFAYDVIIRPVAGATCSGDMWLYPDQVRLTDFLKNIDTFTVATGGAVGAPAGYAMADGDSLKTTTIPGTASGLVTAGSYLGRATWTDINSITHRQDQFNIAIGALGGTVGQTSLFSSLGPTADDRVKPDVIAPGEPIISTLAVGAPTTSSTLGDSEHQKLEGTSMASPHVTGIIALMMQKNNCLTTAQVKQILKDTANDSGLVSATVDPENTFGAGLVNALDAIEDTSENTSCFSGSGSQGGGGGGGGNGTCQLGSMIPMTPATAGPLMALLLSPLAALVFFRRRKN
jgi:hypothetical protein